MTQSPLPPGRPSRRTFVQRSALAAGALSWPAIVPTHLLGRGTAGAGPHADQPRPADGSGGEARFRLVTLDPAHFHAALVQKSMYPDVSPVVHVYAPEGDDLRQHLDRIESFNARSEDPTRWDLRVYTGPDFLDRMLADRAGNIVVISGNNARKTEYIVRSVEAGFNVLADKPMARTPADLVRLEHAFRVAKDKGVLLYDIMTERHEITAILQRALSRDQELFGQLQQGTPDEPAITKEGVHHFSKTVAGAPLIRPAWFFDVDQQGEGIVDVTTHLVDLIQWTVFPGEILKPADVTVLDASRSTTPVTREQFRKVTGASTFPDYLQGDVRDDVLHVYANGAFTYRLRDVHARVSVRWDYEAPPGAGDTHYSIMRGTRANLVIRQGQEQAFKPVLYVERASSVAAAAHDAAMKAAVASLQGQYPGVQARRDGERWALDIPAQYAVGHEAHFGEVTEHFLRYLRDGALPEWEVPGMLTKYATIMRAYERSRR
jgi:predicted dehydrogenase